MSSTKRLARDDKQLESIIKELVTDIEATARAERRRAEAEIRVLAQVRGLTLKTRIKRLTKLEKEAAAIVPMRKFRGPISAREWVRKLSPEDREAFYRLGREHKEASGLENLAAYWSDGARSLLEVSRLVELESGRSDLVYLLGYFTFLEKMGLLGFR